MNLELIYHKMIQVEYFGLKLTVPCRGYLAVDSLGFLIWFSHMPLIYKDFTWIKTKGSKTLEIALVKVPSESWKETLKKVELLKRIV